MKHLLSVKAAAELLNIVPATLYEWCALRQIPHVKVGRRTVFDPDDLEKWLEQRRIAVSKPEAIR